MDYTAELGAFCLAGEPVIVRPYGEGHINQTYYVETDAGKKYILQRINTRLFTDVSALMRNIELVTGHIAQKNRLTGETGLTLVRTKDGAAYLQADSGAYRVYDFIDNATSHQIVAAPALFYESAVAFGDFQNKLTDFDAAQLTEVLPDFHNTVKRLSDFEASRKRDAVGRAREVEKEIDFVLRRRDYADKLVGLLTGGAIPRRVTHNDTKLNNVMISDTTGKAVAVIDLDTVMPGSCLYDFGDSIRFGCNSGAEDEPDLKQVNFRIDLFETYAEGYLKTLTTLTNTEKQNLALSAIVMTYECGMRFLMDHLDGDVYFRIKRPGHNLDRARTQFKLIEDMESRLNAMQKIVAAR